MHENVGLGMKLPIHWSTLLKTLPYKDVCLHHFGMYSGMSWYDHDINILEV